MLISAVINVDDNFPGSNSNLLQSAMRNKHTIQKGDPLTQSSYTRSFIVTNKGLIGSTLEMTEPVEFLVTEDIRGGRETESPINILKMR